MAGSSNCPITTDVPLMRDHKKSPQKWSLKRGLPYLVGNQEVTLKALVPTVFEVTFCGLS